MSRQKGRRARPAPERREYRERYSKKPRPARAVTERPQWTDPISPGRRWSAVLAGTVVALTGFGLIAAAVVEAGDGRTSNAVWLSVGAAATVPVMLAVIAFVSRAAAPWQAVAVAAPVVMALFLAGSFIAREPATGFALGAGVGAALTMRADEGIHLRSWRLMTVLALAGYTKLVYLASPPVAIVAAPLVPIAGIGVIDRVMERRHEAPGTD